MIIDPPTRLGNRVFYGTDVMRVTITKPPGIFAHGVLKGLIAEQDAPFPHIVLEMSVAGVTDPVTVTRDELDLSTIVRLARNSRVQKIQDAVR